MTRREAKLDDPASLEQAFAGCAVVINCAGPFLDTAAPVAWAALRADCHYIDVTAEQASAQSSFSDFAAPARAAARSGGRQRALGSAIRAGGPPRAGRRDQDRQRARAGHLRRDGAHRDRSRPAPAGA
ncbi:MAG: saccharopine dehydrogenase NADP-binding domain-containing protein [Thermoanaerobaculia bacterium]|nr:saccharopine dehydrogenase NADP-binding domain-containing protein [Thermoanaerobaculia bacterium]